MKNYKLKLLIVALAIANLTGCASSTVIFFPRERAAKAVDNVIDEILGNAVTISPSSSDSGKPNGSTKSATANAAAK